MDRQSRNIEVLPDGVCSMTNAMQLRVWMGRTQEAEEAFQRPVIAEIARAEQAKNADTRRRSGRRVAARRAAGGHRILPSGSQASGETQSIGLKAQRKKNRWDHKRLCFPKAARGELNETVTILRAAFAGTVNSTLSLMCHSDVLLAGNVQ